MSYELKYDMDGSPILNRDDKLRQEIMGIKTDYSDSTIHYFEGLTLHVLNELIENGFLDLEESISDDVITIDAFKDFLEFYNDKGYNISLHGYIVSPDRKDYGIVITGVEAYSCNSDFMEDFIDLYRFADDFACRAGYQYCWYP